MYFSMYNMGVCVSYIYKSGIFYADVIRPDIRQEFI